ncbi:hypothetical protein RUM44_006158 [Polyplax serrata]|uniref:C2H2-type domain-containing protein n=1 Tax=Polyplax serrata TaxID=468196 RepID=A0ABR1AZ51_POLSC
MEMRMCTPRIPLSPAAVKALTEADITNPDYFIRCLHCQRAYPGLQALRDHIDSDHLGNLSPNEALSPVQSSYSPVPVPMLGGHHSCSQCSVSFSSKDQLEKHELLHSPNAQVVSNETDFLHAPCELIGVRCVSLQVSSLVISLFVICPVDRGKQVSFNNGLIEDAPEQHPTK